MRSAWPDNWLDEANELVGRREGSHWRGAFLALFFGSVTSAWVFPAK